MPLSGKVAIVTGASQGIGKAVAEDFAKKGAKVVLVSRTQSTLQDVARRIQNTGAEAEYYFQCPGTRHYSCLQFAQFLNERSINAVNSDEDLVIITQFLVKKIGLNCENEAPSLFVCILDRIFLGVLIYYVL